MTDAPEVQKETPAAGMINGIPVKEAWALRRKVIYCILIFSAAIILWGMNIDTPTTLQGQIVEGILTLDMLIVLGWLLGSALEDGVANIANKKYGK